MIWPSITLLFFFGPKIFSFLAHFVWLLFLGVYPSMLPFKIWQPQLYFESYCFLSNWIFKGVHLCLCCLKQTGPKKPKLSLPTLSSMYCPLFSVATVDINGHQWIKAGKKLHTRFPCVRCVLFLNSPKLVCGLPFKSLFYLSNAKSLQNTWNVSFVHIGKYQLTRKQFPLRDKISHSLSECIFWVWRKAI